MFWWPHYRIRFDLGWRDPRRVKKRPFTLMQRSAAFFTVTFLLSACAGRSARARRRHSPCLRLCLGLRMGYCLVLRYRCCIGLLLRQRGPKCLIFKGLPRVFLVATRGGPNKSKRQKKQKEGSVFQGIFPFLYSISAKCYPRLNA